MGGVGLCRLNSTPPFLFLAHSLGYIIILMHPLEFRLLLLLAGEGREGDDPDMKFRIKFIISCP